jgi:hypothetical protein
MIDKVKLTRRAAAEIKTMMLLGQQHVVALDADAAMRMVALLQLATRHPLLPDSQRNLAETLVKAAEITFAKQPACLELISLGRLPERKTVIVIDARKKGA